MTQSFTASKGRVYLSGSVLSDHQVEDLLTQFQACEAEAEKAAHEARQAFNDLWDARCAAVDYRQDRFVWRAA